ncbi:glycosyltransferase family 4 protein [Plesiomonas shigelloides]|uniref:glycosyltransferase family 4 protein n=1 Tax=Plesiomonas shigelloides TaxID=703 RepID=UPI00351CBDA3
MKSIAIVINDISASGGTERVASFLANKLSELGMNVTLVSVVKQGQPFYSLSNSVTISYVDSFSWYKLGLHIKGLGCDSVISISMGRLSFKLALLFLMLNIKSKLILSEHVGFETSSVIIRALKRFSYHFADQLVLLTQHDHNILKPYISTSSIVIPNPTIYTALPKSELANKKNIVLAVGRLNQQKNFTKLIQLWAALPKELHQQWKLRIVGSGEERELLLKVISEKAITESVELVEASKEIHLEYKQASILVMTSRYEGLPLVLIEAKSFGLPAIAFDCKTGPAEIICNMNDGFLIPEHDDDMYVNKLTELMMNKQIRIEMSVNAIDNSSNFSEEHVIKLWENIL